MNKRLIALKKTKLPTLVMMSKTQLIFLHFFHFVLSQSVLISIKTTQSILENVLLLSIKAKFLRQCCMSLFQIICTNQADLHRQRTSRICGAFFTV